MQMQNHRGSNTEASSGYNYRNLHSMKGASKPHTNTDRRLQMITDSICTTIS